MMATPELYLSNLNITLRQGNIVKLSRFDKKEWIVMFGWFNFDNSRKICGWYLVEDTKDGIIKPLTDADIIDIYLIENRG